MPDKKKCPPARPCPRAAWLQGPLWVSRGGKKQEQGEVNEEKGMRNEQNGGGEEQVDRGGERKEKKKQRWNAVGGFSHLCLYGAVLRFTHLGLLVEWT